MDSFMQRRVRDDAEYRRKLATAGKPEVEWQRTAETWFDGSVESVDRRLAMCDRLLTAARGSIGAGGVTNSGLTKIASLEASHKQLQGLRRQFLTASADLEDGKAEAFRGAKLAHDERRWVELEAAKFVRAHDVPRDELQIRARNFAELHTSTLDQNRSESITQAFVHRVAQLHRQFPRQRVASTTPVRQAPDEMMFW